MANGLTPVDKDSREARNKRVFEMWLACDILEPELFRRTDSHFHYIIQSSRSSYCARVGRAIGYLTKGNSLDAFVVAAKTVYESLSAADPDSAHA